MSEDHKRAKPLSGNMPGKPFKLSATVNDKDNVQRVPPPPRVAFIPHPQLAPPGMGGTRLARDAERFMEAKTTAEPNRNEKRSFKPLICSPDKSRTHDR